MAGQTPPSSLLAAIPAMVVRGRQVVFLHGDGELETVDPTQAVARVRATPPLVCHARALARRLGCERFPAYDLLELFAFVRPARFCLPTPRGLAATLGLRLPEDAEEAAAVLNHAARLLLSDLAAPERKDQEEIAALAALMAQGGWLWAPLVQAAGRPCASPLSPTRIRTALHVWQRLPEWEPQPPEPPAGQKPVSANAARQRLSAMLAPGGAAIEPRPQQADYASAVSAAFAPRNTAGTPQVVLAEAGTGVGKTLGYLAPASLWAEQNHSTVWISTYTRNLQHQIDAELDRLHADPGEKARRVVLRKGRENYLCLLNLEEAGRSVGVYPHYAVPIGLMSRWTAATRDGDMQGGDFPGWLPDLVGRGATVALADRRGECVYSLCEHYRRCFIEHSIRRARQADIVIANHALVMIQTAGGDSDDPGQPTRYVFDEGHHVFDAADKAFAGHLTGGETSELRRWLLGAEDGRRSRARGLRRRVEELVAGDEAAGAWLEAALQAARALPGDGWSRRVAGETGLSPTMGPAEAFFWYLRRQVLARASGVDGPYSLEVEPFPPVPGLLDAAVVLEQALAALSEPLRRLAARFDERLDAEAASLDPDQRRRLDAMARGLRRRAIRMIQPWQAMLQTLSHEAETGQSAPGFVDWFGIERNDGRELDMGFYRHYLDPTAPFTAALSAVAHGVVLTSATLTDGADDPEQNWAAAEARTGAVHLPAPALRAQVLSPFNYATQTRVLVVHDVRKDDLAQVAAACRELFLAAGGGGLGLFTAISRLRAVYDRIIDPLTEAGLPLYAQHIDALDTATLIDVFRGEEHACLLGTDAVRDGVDVPGRSLRLIVFDRVPWPRPDLLHQARREAFGDRRRYEDRIVRLRLRQAFGRLIRRADDKGVFVLLDPMMPSRLSGAFPEGVALERIGLAEAVKQTHDFLR